MADNVELNAGSGGVTIAADDVSSVWYQQMKLVDGTLNSTTIIAAAAGTAANALRTTLASDDPAVVSLSIMDDWDESDRAKVNPIVGQAGVAAGAGAVGAGVPRMTLASDDPAVALLGTIDTDTGNIATSTASIDGKVTACDTGAVVIASGTITTITNSVAVTGTFFQATQPVSNAGAFVVQEDGAALTALQLIDDTVATLGTATYVEATTKGLVVGAVRNDTLAPLADTDNELAPLQVNELGALWTIGSPNLIDAGNSTTSPLGIGATFTGTGVDTLGTAGVSIQLFADEDSAANGMRFEFSTDNTNWDHSHRHDYIAGTGRAFQFTSTARYFRLVFINGSTGQSAVRIQTVLHHDTIPSTTIHRLDDSLAPDRSAQVVKASLMAQAAGSGNFLPINATAGGNLKVAVEEFDSSLPAGDNNIGNVDIASSVALDVSVATVTIQGVTTLGTDTYTEATTKGNIVGAVRNDDLATLANTDNEIAPLQVDNQGALYVNPAASEPKRASGVAAGGAPGTDDIVAAVAARKIRVLALGLFATSATTNSVFLDNVDNDLLFNTGNPIALSLDADGDTVAGFVLPYNPGGWFETDAVNEAITLNSSAAQDIAWTITYIEVP